MLNQTKIHSYKNISEKDILNYFYKFPPNLRQEIGMEIERLPINKNGLAAEYSDIQKGGLKEVLGKISQKYGWDKIFDDDVLIGLKKDETTVTLEPGCQVEISLKPQKTISELKDEFTKIDNEIKPVFKEFGITLFESGISPKSTAKDIKVFPKKRYQYMAKYLPGILASSMMRETAGIQVTVDFKNEQDAIKKLRIFTKISPVMTAIFANSPIKGGKLTGYKSTRAMAWLNTDNNRCGLINKSLFDKNYDFTFEDYMNKVLDIPMLYISRVIKSSDLKISSPFKKDILINGKITFREFIKNGYMSYMPEFKDYEIHQSLFFPEVRLKNYLEIRNHDCQNGDLKFCIPAIYKGLAYNENTLNALISLFDEFSFEEIMTARQNVPKYGLEAYIGNKKIVDLAKEIISLAKDGLKDDNDIKYIEPIEELLQQGLCPADLIINDFYAF